MRKDLVYLSVVALFLFSTHGYAQNVAINEDASAPDPNAILDIKSFNKGILIPRVSTTGRLAIPNTKGLLVYDTTANSFFYNTGSGWQNMAAVAGNGWLLHGNSDTDSTSFLGTTDSKPLVIKVNNLRAGFIDSAKGLTFLGYNTGGAINDPSGFLNTAIGAHTFVKNTSGNGNTAVGCVALHENITGFFNTAIGQEALYPNNGSENTAVGVRALTRNTTGFRNTAVGAFALEQMSLGILNTAVGYDAFRSAFSGNNNTVLGAFADIIGNNNNSTAIGAGATVFGANKVRIGNSAVTVIEGQVPFTTPSDARFKFQVQDDVKGLDFILQLHPVTYQFNTKQFDEQLNSGRMKDTAFAAAMKTLDAGYTEATSIRRSGFIAQEVEKAAVAAGYNFSGLIKPKTDKEYYSLSYESFVVPLVKAVQEQQQTINAQNQTIDTQNKKLADLQQQLQEVKKLLQKLP